MSRQVTIWALVCFYYQWQILTLFKFELRLLIRHRGKPHSYIDLSLIRHWYLDQEHALRRSGPRPQLATFMKTSCASGCLLRRGFACSKIVTKCYYFWHKSRGSRAFNCHSQEKEDKHSSLQTGDLNRKEGASGKVCSFIFRKFLKVQHKLCTHNAWNSQTRFGRWRQISDSFWPDSSSVMTKP